MPRVVREEGRVGIMMCSDINNGDNGTMVTMVSIAKPMHHKECVIKNNITYS